MQQITQQIKISMSSSILIHKGCIPIARRPFSINRFIARARQNHQKHTTSMHQQLLVNHPVVSEHDQLAWEQVLEGKHHHTEASMDLEQQQPDSTEPALSHPAVGATHNECAAWEEALSLSRSRRAEADVHLTQGTAGSLFAVVECGSHSTRLLLSTGTADIQRLTRDTHLGAALTATAASSAQQQQQQQQHTGLPQAAATLAAVQEYKLCIDRHRPQVKAVVAVATAAVRDSPQGPSIAAAVQSILHCPVRILSGEQL